MANFCPNCGTKLDDGVRFCPNCGTNLAASGAAGAQGGAPRPQNMGAAPRPQNMGAAPRPQNMGAAPRPQNMGGAPRPQNMGAAPRPQNMGSTPRAQNNGGAPRPQNRGTAPRPQHKGLQSGAPKSGVSILLAGIMVIELVIAGFWQPGFLRSRRDPKRPSVVVQNPGGKTGQSGGSGKTGSTGGKTGSTGAKTAGGTGAKPGGYAGVQDPDENAGLSSVNMDAYWMPPEAEDIDLGYSEQEIAAAPETVMSVGPGSTAAAEGKFAVDFGAYNLGEEDAFSIKELPVHVNEDAGYAVQGYDLSMASGRDVFPLEVVVTIPREESDGDLVMFLSRDPETGENAEDYFEVSEDGKSYLLYTTHFSPHDKVTISDFGKNLLSDVKKGDMYNIETREALSTFFYPTRVPWNERMTAPVAFSPYDLWSKMMNRYTYLPSAYSLMGAAAEKLRKNPKDQVDIGGLFLFDSAELKKLGQDTFTSADALNNLRGATIEPGVQALDLLPLEKVSPGLKETVSGSVNSDFFNWFAAATTCISFALTNYKTEKELEAGKYADVSSAIWGNWLDYAGVAIGTIGLTGAAIASTPITVVTVVASMGGLSLYFLAKSYQTPYDDLMGAERNYRDYYAVNMGQRRFFYDEPALANTNYGINGAIGSIEPLTTLSPAQNERFKQLINEGLKSVYGMGGIMGEDTRSKGVNPEWGAAVSFLFMILKDEPEKIRPAVQEFYQHYAEACRKQGDAAFLEFSREAMKQRNEDPALARLPGDAGSSWEKYEDAMVKELFIKHQGMFLDVTRYYVHQAQIEVNRMIKKELLPILNTPMEFTVVDKSLEKPEEFSKSIYNSELQSTGEFATYATENGRYTDFSRMYRSAMNFCVKKEDGKYAHVGKPVFMPNVNFSKNYQEYENYTVGLSLMKGFYEDYYPAKKNFLPMLTDEKGNVVFRCTYFHYLMMGAPTAMSFRDLTEENGKEVAVPFTIPKAGADGVIRVNIEAAGKKIEGVNAVYKGQSSSIVPRDELGGVFEDALYQAVKEGTLVISGDTVTGSGTATIPLTWESIQPEDYYHESKEDVSTGQFTLSFTIKGKYDPATGMGKVMLDGTADHSQNHRYKWMIGKMEMENSTTSVSFTYSFEGEGSVMLVAAGDGFAKCSFHDIIVKRRGSSSKNGQVTGGDQDLKVYFGMDYKP